MTGVRRVDLRADCERCRGLCCVVPAFAASSDFAITKPARQPCPNLRPDFRCGIHRHLRQRGFTGCTVYDCFGAGQKITQVTFAGHGWRGEPEIADRMFSSFEVMRHLHELLWYLTEAVELRPDDGPSATLRNRLREALERTAALTLGSPADLEALDLPAHRSGVAALLRRTSELVRAGARGREIDHSGADLIGKDLSGADLTGASFRGAYLLGVDLSGADLRLADLLGADLRGANLSGANLATSIFLTQPQLESAIGDSTTRLRSPLSRPAHWDSPVPRPPRPRAGGSRRRTRP